jgi:hypothetical protein
MSSFHLCRARLGLTVALAAGAWLSAPLPVAAQSPVVPSISWIKSLGKSLGQPLLPTAIDLSNRNRIVLQSLTPEAATFLFGSKEPGEAIESLRKRASLSVILSTCSGNTALEGPIAAVSVWEQLDDRESKAAGKVLKEVLELVNDPPGIATPSNLRAPRLPNLVGPVFEYVRGTQTTVVGLLNDTSNDRLMLNWAASDASVCRNP